MGEVNHGATLRSFALREAIAGFDGFKGRLHQIHQSIMVKITGGGNHDAFGLIQAVEKFFYHLSVKLDDILGAAQNRSTQWIFTPIIIARKHVDVFFRAVFHHSDFLQDNGPFFFDLCGIEYRIDENVREDVHHGFRMGIHDPGMVAGIFHGRKRIGMAADSIEFLGDLKCGSFAGALKNHVFDKMGKPAFKLGFVPGTHIDPHPHGHRAGVGPFFADNSNTVFKGSFSDGHLFFPFPERLCGSAGFFHPG